MPAFAVSDTLPAIREPRTVADGTLDVEFPLTTRRTDEVHRRAERRDDGVEVAAGASPPFLARALLAAEAPFGLAVDIKSDQRVVGEWGVEVNLRDPEGTYVSQARGSLYVCASACGDERVTGMFLVVRQWWVNDDEPARADALYGGVSAAVLERLDALAAAAAVEPGEATSCVLVLVDGRRLARRKLQLALLQARLLRDIEASLPIPGIDLRVACGRGIGIAANQSSTLPSPLAPSDAAPKAPTSLRGTIFIPETVSPANALWNRRATDKSRVLSTGFAAEAARAKAR